MIRKQKYLKNYSYRRKFLQSELEIVYYHWLKSQRFLVNRKMLNIYINSYQRYFLVNKFYQTRINNRCLLTNQSRWVFRVFNLSRVVLKEKFSAGVVFGLRKSTW